MVKINPVEVFFEGLAKKPDKLVRVPPFVQETIIKTDMYLSIEKDLLLYMGEMIRKDLIPFHYRMAHRLEKRAEDLRHASDVLSGASQCLDEPEILKMWGSRTKIMEGGQRNTCTQRLYV